MFNLFRKTKTKTNQEQVIEWLQSIGQRQPQLSKDIELLIHYWNERDFKSQKYLQITMPTFFTEWFARVEMSTNYETKAGMKPCTMFNAVRLMDENIEPIAIHYDFSYDYENIPLTRRITMTSDTKPLLNAALENDFYKQKAALTLHYLTVIYAVKIVRHQFVVERKRGQSA